MHNDGVLALLTTAGVTAALFLFDQVFEQRAEVNAIPDILPVRRKRWETPERLLARNDEIRRRLSLA